MDNVYFKNAYGNRVGWIIGDDIKDNSGNRVGFINGNDIKDSGGNRIGFLNGNDFKDSYGNRVGFINGSDIKDANGNHVGYAETGASAIEMCAAALLLLKLEYNDSSTSNYSSRFSPREKHGWLVVAFVLFIFSFWHFLKGPFVAFSKVKETSARKEWWGTCVRSILLGFLFTAIIAMILKDAGNIAAPIAFFFCLAFTILPIVVVSIRRMHDIGKSGWWSLIPLVNFVMCGFFPTNEEAKVVIKEEALNKVILLIPAIIGLLIIGLLIVISYPVVLINLVIEGNLLLVYYRFFLPIILIILVSNAIILSFISWLENKRIFTLISGIIYIGIFLTNFIFARSSHQYWSNLIYFIAGLTNRVYIFTLIYNFIYLFPYLISAIICFVVFFMVKIKSETGMST